ncbi:unnamed protein product, partial [marine sediment metagenome]
SYILPILSINLKGEIGSPKVVIYPGGKLFNAQ